MGPETQARLQQWAAHFAAPGADSFTAQSRAVAMLYHDTVSEAQVLAYVDDFWLLAVLLSIIPLFLPLMRRVRVDAPPPEEADAASSGRVPSLPAPVE